MSSKLQLGVTFIFGIAIGSVITWHSVKEKYERLAQDEINSVKQMFLKKTECKKEGMPSDASAPKNEVMDEAKNILKANGYIQEDTANESGEIYVIAPEEFGNRSDYDTISLTYYADGTLADEYDEIVNDVEDTVGTDSLNHFGEYEEDSVFVRNEIKKCDYEILLDESNYVDVIKNS